MSTNPKRVRGLGSAPPRNYGAKAVCETKKFFDNIVSWEDEEPTKIEDLLKEVEQK